jgi:hypothetical protein
MADAFQDGFWAVLELMGHRRLGGKVTEEEHFGAKMCRIDIPSRENTICGPKDVWTTQYYGGGSIYCLTPCSEDAARIAARMSRPEPVHPWELPALPASSGSTGSSAESENHCACGAKIDWDEAYCDKCLDAAEDGAP